MCVVCNSQHYSYHRVVVTNVAANIIIFIIIIIIIIVAGKTSKTFKWSCFHTLNMNGATISASSSLCLFAADH